MKSKLTFSIIIPTLNEEKYLPNLLKSIEKQTYMNLEVFVVDGQSKDNTQKIVKSFQKKIKNLKLIKSSKRNVSFQRNLGAKRASGKYLLFIDADVAFEQNILEKIYQYIKKNSPPLFDTHLKFRSAKTIYKILSCSSCLFFQITSRLKRNIAIGQFLGIKKSVFNQIGGYNERLALSEEHNLVKSARKLNYHFHLLNKVKVYASPRRIEKEGMIKFLLKYLYFSIYEHVKGPIYNKPPLSYPMGGHHYD